MTHAEPVAEASALARRLMADRDHCQAEIDALATVLEAVWWTRE